MAVSPRQNAFWLIITWIHLLICKEIINNERNRKNLKESAKNLKFMLAYCACIGYNLTVAQFAFLFVRMIA